MSILDWFRPRPPGRIDVALQRLSPLFGDGEARMRRLFEGQPETLAWIESLPPHDRVLGFFTLAVCQATDEAAFTTTAEVRFAAYRESPDVEDRLLAPRLAATGRDVHDVATAHVAAVDMAPEGPAALILVLAWWAREWLLEPDPVELAGLVEFMAADPTAAREQGPLAAEVRWQGRRHGALRAHRSRRRARASGA